MPFKETVNMENIPSESQYKAYVSEQLSIRQLVFRNILIINDANEERFLTERAPIYIDHNNNVYFRDLIIYLRDQNLIAQGSSLFFYDVERNYFVHQGKEPVSSATMVPLTKFSKDEIIIKYRSPSITQEMREMGNNFASNSYYGRDQIFCNNKREQESRYSSVIPENNINNNTYPANEDEDNNSSTHDVKAIPREKRVKERKIGYVYDRVMEWRKFYEVGVLGENGRIQKVNLDVAASLVGLSRKTLDDYYKYIRKANMYNFDFQAKADEKIGVLRNFVRDRQKRCNKQLEMDDICDDDYNNKFNKNDNIQGEEEEQIRINQDTFTQREMNYQMEQENEHHQETMNMSQQNSTGIYSYPGEYDSTNQSYLQRQFNENNGFLNQNDNLYAKEQNSDVTPYGFNIYSGAQPEDFNFLSNDYDSRFDKNLEQED